MAVPIRFHERPVFWAVVVLAVLALAVGYVLFHGELGEVREARSAELGAIADLTIDQLRNWRQERRGDAEFMASGPFVRQAVRRLIVEPGDAELLAMIGERLDEAIRLYGYSTILIATADGRIIVARGSNADALTRSEKSLLSRAVGSTAPVFGDIDLGDASAAGLTISLATAVRDVDGTPFGVLVFRRDPARDVLQIVERRPVFSRTAETVLARREGDRIRYLSRLRHASDPPASRTIPMSAPGSVTARALASRKNETLDGVDYRGVPVFAVVRSVPGTGWVLVAKMDREEMLTEARNKLRTAAIVITLATLLFLAMLNAYFGRQQQAYYRELYAAERDRREAEEETRATVYSIGDAVITTDAATCVRRMNPVAEHLTGWTEHEARGRPLRDVFRVLSEDTGDDLDDPAGPALREGRIVALAGSNLLLARDGRRIPIETSAAPIRGAIADEPNGVVLVFRDQTEERERQRALRRDATRLRILFEQAQDGIVLIHDGRVLECNAGFARLLGRDAGEVLQSSVWDWAAELDTPGKYFARYPDTPSQPARIETRLRRPDGTIVDVEVVFTPIEWDGRRVAFSIVRDIAERKRMEEALRLSEQQFREFAETLPQLTWMARPDGQGLYHNRRWVEYTGFSESELNAGAWFGTIHADDAPAYEATVRKALAEGHPFEIECRLRRKDGRYLWHLSRGIPVQDAEGRIGRWIGFLADIHDIKASREVIERELAERTRDLVEARDQARTANRVKDIFLATMSHELRTPLNSIIGFTSLLLDGLTGPLSEAQRRQVEIVNKSGHHLLGLISDVLDISKIETGRLPIEEAPLDLRRLIEEQLRGVETEARERGLALEADLPGTESGVLGDEKRVRQVIDNLLSNAIKYTSEGRVTVRVRPLDGHLRVEVEDTGIGIAAEDQPKLFQPFYRAALPKGMVCEGSGLGLAISRRLVAAMGGEIGVRSEPGQGSCFWFTLRRA